MKLTCSYKNKLYETTKFNGKYLGSHYGSDFTGDKQIWGSGNGTVIKTGYDNCFGNFVVVKYEDVYNHKTKKTIDVICRYFHMASVSVTSNQKINKDTKLGIMGSTGQYATGVHCHMEADTDTTYWNYTPSLSGSSTFFKAGLRGDQDTTFNVLELLYIKETAPDDQEYHTVSDGYINSEDKKLPVLE